MSKLAFDEYIFRMADIAASKSSCVRRQVGAIIVRDQMIISTGYNGTPIGVKNCNEGGCPRCNRADVQTGKGYEECLCVHAEQNAISFAARHGVRTDGASIYVTSIEPCLGCLKSIVQAGIMHVYAGIPEESEGFFWHDQGYTDVLWGADGMRPNANLHVVKRKRLALGGEHDERTLSGD